MSAAQLVRKMLALNGDYLGLHIAKMLLHKGVQVRVIVVRLQYVSLPLVRISDRFTCEECRRPLWRRPLRFALKQCILYFS